MIKNAFMPTAVWGPRNPLRYAEWRQFKETLRKKKETRTSSKLKQFLYVVVGQEDKLT